MTTTAPLNIQKNLPAPNRFFAKDILYPDPISSKSIPDKDAPSHINCSAAVAGLLGPDCK